MIENIALMFSKKENSRVKLHRSLKNFSSRKLRRPTRVVNQAESHCAFSLPGRRKKKKKKEGVLYTPQARTTHNERAGLFITSFFFNPWLLINFDWIKFVGREIGQGIENQYGVE